MSKNRTEGGGAYLTESGWTADCAQNGENKPGPVILLGYFDGFHLGHQALADAACRLKESLGAPGVMLWTFRSLAKGSRIMSNDEKTAAFFSYTAPRSGGGNGCPCSVIYEEFASFAPLSGEAFVRDVLWKTYHPSAVVCGFNFRFGRGGSCGADDLARYCEALGIVCRILPPVYWTEEGRREVISSTKIRAMISSGDVAGAMAWMGHPYAVTAVVEHGKELGRRLGFPTINQRIPPDKVKPARGIYACTVTLPEQKVRLPEQKVRLPEQKVRLPEQKVRLPDQKVRLGVANIGSRPTVNDDERDVTLETSIFDYAGSLYGETVTVSLYQKLRDEQKFDSPEALAAQIARDKEAALRFFEKRRRMLSSETGETGETGRSKEDGNAGAAD